MHAIGTGHALVFLSLMDSRLEIRNRFRIIGPVNKGKPPLIIVPPSMTEGPLDGSVFFSAFDIGRLPGGSGTPPAKQKRCGNDE